MFDDRSFSTTSFDARSFDFGGAAALNPVARTFPDLQIDTALRELATHGHDIEVLAMRRAIRRGRLS